MATKTATPAGCQIVRDDQTVTIYKHSEKGFVMLLQNVFASVGQAKRMMDAYVQNAHRGAYRDATAKASSK